MLEVWGRLLHCIPFNTDLSIAPHGGDPTMAFATAFGTITDYSFSMPVGSTPFSVTSFNIATASAPTTSVYSRAINTSVFVLFSTSFWSSQKKDANNEVLTEVVIRAAVSYQTEYI
jgi:hypothetical protein